MVEMVTPQTVSALRRGQRSPHSVSSSHHDGANKSNSLISIGIDSGGGNNTDNDDKQRKAWRFFGARNKKTPDEKLDFSTFLYYFAAALEDTVVLFGGGQLPSAFGNPNLLKISNLSTRELSISLKLCKQWVLLVQVIFHH